jgi:hypothetical protein
MEFVMTGITDRLLAVVAFVETVAALRLLHHLDENLCCFLNTNQSGKLLGKLPGPLHAHCDDLMACGARSKACKSLTTGLVFRCDLLPQASDLTTY